VLTSLGYKQREIAEELGVTEKSVETILYRHRKRIERRDCMSKRNEPGIEVLIERSSLGTREARQARRSVSKATGRMLVNRAAKMPKIVRNQGKG
jgi:predicted transcriptional regulator